MAQRTLSVKELRRGVEARQIAPVYLVLGEESALRGQAREALQAALEERASESPTGVLVRLDGGEVSLAEILDEARSLPLFAFLTDPPCRLVWVSRFDEVAVDDTTLLDEYFSSPVPETCLVLEAAKLDKRRAVYKCLAKGAEVVECGPLKRESDARRWIENRVRDAGLRIMPEAVSYLTAMTGTNLSALEQELEKAILSVGGTGTIAAEDLEGLLGRSREHSVFELTEALVRRRDADALQVLNLLLDDGEEPLRVLAMIAWITRQMVVAYDLAAAGKPRKEVVEALGGRWDQRGEIFERARHSTRNGLTGALTGCADTDLFVKRLTDSRKGADRLRPARGRLEALCRQICVA